MNDVCIILTSRRFKLGLYLQSLHVIYSTDYCGFLIQILEEAEPAAVTSR